MLQIIKVNMLFLVGILVIFVLALTNANPMSIYDEFVDNDEKQLLIRMAEFIESIGADDSEYYDSGRLVSSKIEKNPSTSTTGNELKDMKPGERCILPVRKGVCRALIPRWSYDPIARDCREFKFGCCDGNGNNFPSRKHCMEVCRGI